MSRINVNGYLDTCADKLLVPLKCISRATLTKALQVLKRAGYIDVQLVPCKTNRMLHHYRIYIVASKFPSARTINNIHFVDNKNNKSILIEKQIQKKNDQKPKNTTVQDMVSVFNQVADTNITANQVFSVGLSQYMYQAFKCKFLTIDKWKSYLQKNIRKNQTRPEVSALYSWIVTLSFTGGLSGDPFGEDIYLEPLADCKVVGESILKALAKSRDLSEIEDEKLMDISTKE
ncbi:MAG: hypothetical protein E7015_04135 [Alphaproteobacteria bacterium]|nr:hypothetical protein [Alphaproteobacteria bacterium]